MNKIGSGYTTACGSSCLKPFSTATCNMTVTHVKSAVGLAVTLTPWASEDFFTGIG